jgi:hypothetical protein
VLVHLTTPLREALRQEAGELRARIPDLREKAIARGSAEGDQDDWIAAYEKYQGDKAKRKRAGR